MIRYGALVVVAALLIVVALFEQSAHEPFRNVGDDRCPKSSIGEPDRGDPDCYRQFPDGRNWVEEWDLAHPSPDD